MPLSTDWSLLWSRETDVDWCIRSSIECWPASRRGTGGGGGGLSRSYAGEYREAKVNIDRGGGKGGAGVGGGWAVPDWNAYRLLLMGGNANWSWWV